MSPWNQRDEREERDGDGWDESEHGHGEAAWDDRAHAEEAGGGIFGGSHADDDPAHGPLGGRPPFWVWIPVVLDVFILVALLPAVIVLLFPPFFVYFVELAKILVWISPLLIAGNVAALVWGFPRRRPVITGFALLGLAFVGLAFAVAVYASGGRDPITVFGVPFGGNAGEQQPEEGVDALAGVSGRVLF